MLNFFPLQIEKRPFLKNPKDASRVPLSPSVPLHRCASDLGSGQIVSALEEEGSHVKREEPLALSLFQAYVADRSTGPQNTVVCLSVSCSAQAGAAGRKEPHIQGSNTHSPNG